MKIKQQSLSNPLIEEAFALLSFLLLPCFLFHERFGFGNRCG
jgi:hypothetical protein